MPQKQSKTPYKYEEVGTRLRRWRESLQFSLEAFASRVGYSVNGYRKLERGERKLSPEFLQLLHTQFGVSPDTFLTGEEPATSPGRHEWEMIWAALTDAQRDLLLSIAAEMLAQSERFPDDLPDENLARLSTGIVAAMLAMLPPRLKQQPASRRQQRSPLHEGAAHHDPGRK